MDRRWFRNDLPLPKLKEALVMDLSFPPLARGSDHSTEMPRIYFYLFLLYLIVFLL